MTTVNNTDFEDILLKLYTPDFGSSLTEIIIDLEKLRVNRLGGQVPPHIFFQLKEVFHFFESLGSARIEGNRTTLAEFVERLLDPSIQANPDEKMREILNIEKAIHFIHESVNKSTTINRAIISEIHKILMNDLTPPPTGEGSRSPGILRGVDVSIQNAKFSPPSHIKVPEYFEEIMSFVNQSTSAQHHLLIAAIAHHRLTWIHPFDNGNGRLVRLFTYALLIKQGFQVKTGRIINPTAVFCLDRNRYYDMLAKADSGKEEDVLAWCEYVLGGLKHEIEKVDKLLDLKFMIDKILLPALAFSLERQHVTDREYAILCAVVKSQGMQIRSADIEKVIGIESSVHRARIIGALKEKGMLRPLTENGRTYTLGFVNNYLLRGVVHALEKNGFIPESLNK